MFLLLVLSVSELPEIHSNGQQNERAPPLISRAARETVLLKKIVRQSMLGKLSEENEIARWSNTRQVTELNKENQPVKRPRKNHLELAQRILEMARREGLRPGARLPEQQVASQYNVSRTPVRAALNVLAEKGFVSHQPGIGYLLDIDLATASDLAEILPQSRETTLAAAILRDRRARRLSKTVTVGELMRRYVAERSTVLKSLNELAGDDLVSRAPGQSWIFQAMPDEPASLAESYDFRLVLEPAAVLNPGFSLDGAKAQTIYMATENLLALTDAKFDVAEFRRLDFEFHRLIASGCRNRYIGEALGAHLKLRRHSDADTGINLYRLRQALRDHLQILDNLERGQSEVAADLLRVHLRVSHNQRPQAVNRGAPPLAGAIFRMN